MHPWYVDLWNDAVQRVVNEFRIPRTVTDLEPWIWLLGALVTGFLFLRGAWRAGTLLRDTIVFISGVPNTARGRNKVAEILEEAAYLLEGAMIMCRSLLCLNLSLSFVLCVRRLQGFKTRFITGYAEYEANE